jgi:putative transcriptional regulator
MFGIAQIGHGEKRSVRLMNTYIHRWTRNGLWVIASCLLIGVLEARAQDFSSKPMMLVASPSLQGGYSKSVIVVVPRDGVHVGFIVNYASEVKLAALFPSHLPSEKVAEPVFFGGPQMAETVFAVVNRNPGAEAWPLFGDFFVATASTTIDQIIEQTPNDARYFAGFVGWKAGELAKEIASGWWYVTDPEPSVLMGDPRSAWEGLVRQLGNGHPIPRGMLGASL